MLSVERDTKRRRIGVPRRAAEVLQRVEQTAATDIATRWVDQRKPADWCLVLSGPKGCGKSVAAAMAITKLMEHRNAFPMHGEKKLRLWWTAAELACVDSYGGELAALCDFTGPLVLDDLGSEYADAKGFFSQILDRLVDARYREYGPTIITTNLNAELFKKRFSERITDRLREGGQFLELGASKSMRGAT